MADIDVFDELTWKERDGLRLRAIRRRNSLTQIELADKAGISRGIVGQLELGRHIFPIRIGALLAIAEALRTPPEAIFPDTMQFYHEKVVEYFSREEHPPDDIGDLEDIVKLAERAKQCA